MNGIQHLDHKLLLSDILGMIRVRLGLFRNSYTVAPGLYMLGQADKDSKLFVSSNYKYSFDILRNSLKGHSCWILVLDTKGINVWCAAGKGSFGTEELVRRIKEHELDSLIEHKELILPQLSATGVAAHEVTKETGYKVVYGPVRAPDIPRFLENGCKADAAMRTVNFTFSDRLKLVPMELLVNMKPVLGVLLLYLLMTGIRARDINVDQPIANAKDSAVIILGAFFVSASGMPVLLPFLPFRSFVLKGLSLGSLYFVFLFNIIDFRFSSIEKLSWYLLIISLSMYVALNFTGAATYTSQDGVKKELKISLPAIFISFLTAVGLWLANRMSWFIYR